jgi:carbamoyl-phosphate synthase large subunit
MPKRNDLKTILIIGSGPIVIGQACEFDYSGTQACRVLREEGYRVVLANSNPATIMTDPDFADRTYIEPLTVEVLKAIIEREKPDAVLPTLGGQTALNLAMALHAAGVVGHPGTPELIGANAEAIATAEDRDKFKQAMIEIGLSVPRSGIAHSMAEADTVLAEIGLPVIIRPAYILGGRGTGIAHTKEQFVSVVSNGLSASPINEVLIESSIAGWKEYELEVMRDRADNCVIICSIENVDPMGVHTGDSITVAPAMTLSDVEYQQMRDAAFACIRRVGVETGGSNVQFAVNPETGEQVVIEMNPRVSRSSALASQRSSPWDTRWMRFPTTSPRRPPQVSSRRSTTWSPRFRAGRSRNSLELLVCSALRCKVSVNRWRSVARSRRACKRHCARSKTVTWDSTAIPPKTRIDHGRTTRCWR